MKSQKNNIEKIMHTLLKYEFRKKVNECKPLQYLIHNVVERNIDVITQREYNVDDSRIAQEACQAINHLKQEWKGVNGKTVTLTPEILFDKYLALSSSLPDNVSL